MSGEKSKTIGDAGEAAAKKFLDFLGWTPRSALSFNFDCSIESHKTPNEKTKKTHGIDFVRSYTCPYTQTEKVILIDSKAIKWGDAKGKIKNTSSISNEISRYVADLHQKVICSNLSKNFKTQTGIETFQKAEGLIIYFCHDNLYNEEVFEEALKDASMPKDSFKSNIFILGNRRLNMLYSMFKKIENIKKQIGNEATHKFCYFELEQHPLEGTQKDYLTIESLLSNFLFLKVLDNKNNSSNHVFYFGSYEPDSIKMFISSIYRFQIHLMDNLHFYPVSMNSPIESMNGIEIYIQDNKLVYDEKEVLIKKEEIDLIEYRLTI